jgi:glucose/arabinose dehydrogenase
MIAALSLLPFLLQAAAAVPQSPAPVSHAAQAPQESDYYAVDYLVPPPGAVIEVGGMDFTQDGRLVVSTRRGQVWIVDKPLADNPKDAGFHLYAEGLWEGLGLKVYKNDIFVLQRGELSRLSDVDGDGVCDRIDVVADGWGLSTNYHEFAYGLPVDEAGTFFFSLNVGFGDPKWWAGKSFAPYRGWIMQATRDGVVTPYACGFRSPCGISISPQNEMFVTDNQGDWEPVCPLYHVHRNKFYGHPASLKWTEEYLSTHTEPSDTIPPSRSREAPSLWIPYKWVRSAGNCAWDQSLGEFGPFEDQMFIAELTNGMVVRTSLEKVRGEYQGAVFLFRQKIGSVVRIAFATGGTLFCGMTNRGWGGLAPADGIARMRWTGKTPFEMRDVHVIDHGFQVVFTQPLAANLALTPANIDLLQYHYDYYWEYGSPERDTTSVEVKDVSVSADRKTLTLHAPGLQAGNMARVVLSGITSASGAPLLHEEFDYTLNQFPDGPLCETPIARVVPPPAGRESKEEGWLRLCYDDALDQWNAKGWKLCDADLDPKDPTKFAIKDGYGALVNTEPDASDFVSKPVFGDAEVRAGFTLPEGGSGGLYLQGRYEIVIAPNERSGTSKHHLCGSIAGGATWPGYEPKIDAWKGAGQEHDVEVEFRAPRFDASGKKTKNARIDRLSMDDVLLYENVEIPEPSAGADPGEVARGPLRFHANGEIALGGIRARPLDDAPSEAGFTPLFDGDDLAGWSVRPNGKDGDTTEWKVDDHVLTSAGKSNFLVSDRSDYKNFELEGLFKLGTGGRSTLWLRATPSDASTMGDAGMKGYAVVLNTSFPDKQRTGGLLDVAPIHAQLVNDDTWFGLGVTCRDEPNGTHVEVRVNGVLFTDYVDKNHKFASGAIALEQHHEGSVLELKKLAIRESK